MFCDSSQMEPTVKANQAQAGSDQFGRGIDNFYRDEFVKPIIMGSASMGKTVFIIAEPGMGKTYLTAQLIEYCDELGYKTHKRSFEDYPSDVACSRVTRYCRDLARKTAQGSRSLVVLDGIAPSDEAESLKEANAIKRLVSAGATVVICLRPEAEQLAEQFHSAVCLRGDDLMYRITYNESRAAQLTGGIPSLVSALRSDISMGESVAYTAPRYMAAVSDLVKKTLRTHLPDEEYRIRLAMVLLGAGTIDDVVMVAGRCDIEQFVWLKRDAPLFGIDPARKTFDCHGLRHVEVLEYCVNALQEAGSAERELVLRACGVLASRGQLRRSAAVCKLCSSRHDYKNACLTWGASYVMSGEAVMVRNALDAARLDGDDLGPKGRMALAAVASIVGTSTECAEAFKDTDNLFLSTSNEVRLMRDAYVLRVCRDALKSPNQAVGPLAAKIDDAAGMACLDHLRVVRLLASGRFSEAYTLLSNETVMRDPQTIPEMYLCQDLALAAGMTGATLDTKERRLLDAASAFTAHMGVKSVSVYSDAIRAIPEVLMSSETNTSAIEEAAVRAERGGDLFMQAVCLAVCAVVDVRTRALSRAHVRAGRASEIARMLEQEYLASAAEFVDAVALELLGESGALRCYCARRGRPEDLMIVGCATARALGELEEHDGDTVIPAGTPCPKDSLWAIGMLARDCPEIWGMMRELVPPSWPETFRALVLRRSAELEVAPDILLGIGDYERTVAPGLTEGEQLELLEPDASQALLRINILGGFALEHESEQLGEKVLDRRRARDLVALLALVPGHRIRRYRAIEVLWPHEDYYRGLRRLYESTGEVRRRLMKFCGANVILSDRTQGSIGLDMSVVSCDLDDFERAARCAVAEDGDDFRVLEHAKRMVNVYANGPDEHLTTLGQVIRDRCQELQTLYVDGAVAAGEAALRLGKAKLAVRYGEDAHRLGDLREDAMILLVRALRAAGRSHEIPDLFRRYSRELVDRRGMPPSNALRRAVDLALGEVPQPTHV